jgi:hypothetical protein
VLAATEQTTHAEAFQGSVEFALELPPDRSFDAVGRLVAAGLGSRTDLGVDRIEQVQLALEAVRRCPAAAGPTKLTLTRAGDALTLRIGPVRPPDCAEEVERVLSGVVHDLELERSRADSWVTLRLPVRHESRCPS